MSQGKIEYRVMLHPSGEIENLVRKQLCIIAKNIFAKNTSNVIYRVRTVDKQTNPRKIFVPGNGDIIEAELLPHIAFSQKIVVNKEYESKIIKVLNTTVGVYKPFTLQTSEVGDYGEDFTIYLAFEDEIECRGLFDEVNKKLKPFFGNVSEKRDVLHITLYYDDTGGSNMDKVRKIIDSEKLLGKKMPVLSLWLWSNRNGWKPIKEFVL